MYRESRRDVSIVLIGRLIALGAAMLLEAVRPFVESWAAAGSVGGVGGFERQRACGFGWCCGDIWTGDI